MRSKPSGSWAALIAALVVGCSASGGGDEPGETVVDGTGGGSLGAAGASVTGGGAGKAGGSSDGGAGGSRATGGSPASGGSQASGGSRATGGSQASGGSAGTGGAGGVTALGCPDTQAAGTWKNVTDPGMKMSGDFTNGPITIGVDAARPSDIFAHVQHDGTWKSSDCGLTWRKVSTGQNADKQATGSQWYAAIDRNPHRDPATSPTLYVTQGYGAGAVWKSTNGGVDWTNVWDNNVFGEDGTNIFADVGSDIHEVLIPDEDGPDHVLVTLHSYWGSGDNNGVFETTDGGGKWTVHKAQTFSFQPHSDILSYFDKDTWMVCHGITYPDTQFYRTTDGGGSWVVGQTVVSMVGRAFSIVDGTIYAGTDFNNGVYRSTDRGVTWKKLGLPANQISWVVGTATKLYASNSYQGPAEIWSASRSNDEVWVNDGNPSGMVKNGANTPGVIFDGSHYVIVAAQGNGGLWRYVEPSP